MISIVLACRNEEKHIAGCVRSILGQARVPDEMELIVADGMSDDRTREVLSEIAATDPRVRVVDNPGRIAATGLNAAIRAARGQIILRMDAHTEYAPDYVRRCVEVLEETGADNVGGPARTRATTYMQGAIAAAYNSPYSVGGARFHDVDYEGWLDTVTYGCWRREIFDRIGLFDEELVRNQDDEFNLRTVRAGGRIWQSPSIRSWYSPRGSLRALFAQYRQYGYWKVRVIQKHRLPASIRHLVPGAFVLALGGLGLAAPFSRVAAVGLRTILGAYGAVLLAASLLTARRAGWRYLAVLPAVFACYHVSYGIGFMRGILDWVVLRRSPGASFIALTRRGA